MEIKYAVFKLLDVELYAPITGMDKLKYVSEFIEEGRRRDGRTPFNEYLVINRDEPYANEIIEIMKRHDHWDDDEKKS